MSVDNQKFAVDFSDEIRHFIRFVEADEVADDYALRDLSSTLSRLLDFGERCPESWSDEKIDAPEQDRKTIQAIVSKRFPDFGIYNSSPPDPTPINDVEIEVNDASDDIYDIYHDLNEALWYFDKGNSELGLWSAKHLFGHWGRHAINLKSYLHKHIHEW